MTDLDYVQEWTESISREGLGIIDTPLRLCNLSEGGCFVTALHTQPATTEFEMQIELPFEGPIVVVGRPRYERPHFGYGVQFTQVDDISADKLHRSLSRLAAAS